MIVAATTSDTVLVNRQYDPLQLNTKARRPCAEAAEQREVAQNCCLDEVKELGDQRKDGKSKTIWVKPREKDAKV